MGFIKNIKGWINNHDEWMSKEREIARERKNALKSFLFIEDLNIRERCCHHLQGNLLMMLVRIERWEAANFHHYFLVIVPYISPFFRRKDFPNSNQNNHPPSYMHNHMIIMTFKWFLNAGFNELMLFINVYSIIFFESFGKLLCRDQPSASAVGCGCKSMWGSVVLTRILRSRSSLVSFLEPGTFERCMLLQVVLNKRMKYWDPPTADYPPDSASDCQKCTVGLSVTLAEE